MLLEFDNLQVTAGEVLAVFGSTNLNVTTVVSVTVRVNALKDISSWGEVASGMNCSVFIVIWSTLAVCGGYTGSTSTRVSDDFPFNFFWIIFKMNNDIVGTVIFIWV